MYFMNIRQRIIQHSIFIIRTTRCLLRLIASCGLLLAVLIGAVSAQQPAPAAPSTQAADSGPGVSGAANAQAVSSRVSERERILLERIEPLERRLNEPESRLNATAADGGKAAAATAQPLQRTNVPPQQNPAQPTATTAAQQQPTQTPQAQTTRATRKAPAPAPAPYAAWEKDGVKIIPFGILIANINYNSSGLDPGSIVGFALPGIPTTANQFNISPGNTLLGVDIKWPKIGKW